ncbi:ribose 1,5-bisphosphokinase [Trinickia symbiotica]|uniref:Ribose 1,5-bisphosphate phosphokinase PhnN n=1 Tax=Trinickia symbiotica TaxID=863227 RepID=A0A2N7X1G8_9BURK|nr:phosphonate metabolism protein/1,5-bisphosphokinase (PRPP-forming) PhnN [Trinickia symbiotica]PMS35477.1 phosphonate metabolism protein/1,5-bisphosphokinase (PRPP-forming) PhnN [Trinickia symbiotica]PPK45506.1 ribose 1,5-bisphosphokinase [Trinickia symbiotica]
MNLPPQVPPKGRLVYVMGPSGAGKDTLLGYARDRLSGSRVIFAHRYITREAGAGGENHIYLSHEEFGIRAELGLFVLQWSSHGLRYGIGIEIEEWMDRGFTVVVNGSREYLQQAVARYPTLAAVHIDARPEVLAARLASRGRETLDEVHARLARRVPLAVPAQVALATIDNSGEIEEAGRALLEVLAAE